MKIRIRFFASLREALETSELELETTAETVVKLRASLAARGGAWAEVLGTGRAVRASLNHDMVDGDAPLSEGAEVAFFPPVTGG